MLSHKIVKNIFNAAVCDMMIEENGSLTPSEQRILQQVAEQASSCTISALSAILILLSFLRTIANGKDYK